MLCISELYVPQQKQYIFRENKKNNYDLISFYISLSVYFI